MTQTLKGRLAIPSLTPYTKRGQPPAQYHAAWFGTELDNLQRAMVPVQVRRIARSQSLDPQDAGYTVDATAGDVVLTLPPADQVKNRMLWVKKVDASANTVSFSQPVDGVALTLSTQGDVAWLASDGVAWVQLNV